MGGNSLNIGSESKRMHTPFLHLMIDARRVTGGVGVALLLSGLCALPRPANAAAPAAAAAPVPTRYDPEDKGLLTAGNLSVGKFYRFSRPPDAAWPDAFGSRWSDGTKLTDDAPGDAAPPADALNCVGWQSAAPVEITVDLGRPQTLERAVLSFAIGELAPPGARAAAPRRIEIQTQRPKIRALIWENHATRIIASDEKALAAYRRLVQDDYWLAETAGTGKIP